MALSALKNKRGVTLIEMMVALTVLLFVSLAMMQVALVGISANRRNSLRDEGTRLASLYMNDIRTRSLADRTTLINSPLSNTVSVNFKSDTVPFTVLQSITDNPGTTWDQAEVKVEWGWRGDTFNTTLTTLVETETN
jgi:prepilin-type N-terminal cleavage/methylation domain-containing protein